MARYQAILSYDGTAFAGFEAQVNKRTVQGELEKALKVLKWGGRRIMASGRTDAGVHAAGQVIAFDLEWRHGEEPLQAALNAIMPDDVAIRKLSRARDDFHPRFDARRRCYRYGVQISRWRDPLTERYVLRLAHRPDIDKMNEAAGTMLGEHDFQAFGTAPKKGSHTRRTVFRAEWIEPERNCIEFWLEANAFLYRMVRITVGTLLQVGRGTRSVTDFQRLMELNGKERAGPAVPAKGLCLERIVYPEDAINGQRVRERQASSSLES
jgi:tRNA pseudouridine38-40 synthase